jgi:hypothetical protein
MSVAPVNLFYLGLAKEATPGTYVAPTVYLPVTNPKPADVIAAVKDEGLRGNNAVLQGQYPGISSATFDFDGDLYPDTIGNLFAAIVGPDTVTGTAPYTHTFKTTTAQPPSYSLTYFDGVETRGFPGCKCSDLSFKLDAKGALTYSSKWIGYPSASESAPTAAFTALQPFLGWEHTFTAAGASSTRPVSVTWDFKRAVEAVHAATGTQAPREIFAPGLDVSGSSTNLFDVTTDETAFLAYTPLVLVSKFTQPAGPGGATLQITSSAAVYNEAPKNFPTGKYVELAVKWDSVYNATDVGPAAVVLTNAVAAAY